MGSMSHITSNAAPPPPALSVVCLGTGKGASMVYDGECSSSYVLCADGNPIVLFGAGYGVTRQCLRYFGRVPSSIVVFSNRSHMSAELPVIIDVESHKGHFLSVIADEEVMRRLRQHRLAEMYSRVDSRTLEDSRVCDFVSLRDLSGPPETHASRFYIPDAPVVSLIAFKTLTTEVSCGIVVEQDGVPVLALTGDCAFNMERHCKILSLAPIVILDGRRRGSVDHASFDEIARAVEVCERVPQRVFIGQYGSPSEAPPVTQHSVVSPIVEGAMVSLGGPCLRIEDAKDAIPHDSLIKANRDSSTVDTRPKKVFFINHDSPDVLPSLIMVHQFRTMAQVKQRVSDVLHLRPIGDLFSEETGQKVKSLAQFSHGGRVIVTRVGGRPFVSPPPKLMTPKVSKTCSNVVAVTPNAPANRTLEMKLDDYMQRAHRRLRSLSEPMHEKNPNTSPELHKLNESPLWTKTELSPESPKEKTETSIRHEERCGNSVGLSLRFTTLRS